MAITVFYNLMTEVPSHHFCCILSVTSKILGPTHTQKKGITQRCESPWLLGDTLEGEKLNVKGKGVKDDYIC